MHQSSAVKALNNISGFDQPYIIIYLPQHRPFAWRAALLPMHTLLKYVSMTSLAAHATSVVYSIRMTVYPAAISDRRTFDRELRYELSQNKDGTI